MAFSMDDVRTKAGSAVAALAHRAASRGKTDPDQSPKKGWIKGTLGNLIDPDKYREAIAYYDIAASITPEPNRAFCVYQKAILLEELGEFAEAEKIYLSLSGTHYEQPGAMGVRRCKAKQQGTYDIRQEANDALTELAGRIHEKGGNASGLDAVREIFGNVFANLGPGGGTPSNTPGQEAGESKDEQASSTALRFVNLLLDKKYVVAKTMLHSSLSGTTAKELQDSFESLFTDDEEFPQSANVLGVHMDWPQLQRDDLAGVYVSIDSENAEAVTVIVTRQNGKLTIREIEWGRP